ncbi:acetamidase/formamidase family protein [Mesorhizobium sp. RP14(2022)]|uniref:Acetamidase/formamidase family protein n=1 Tax=Mesorhizobium liriopis TaxID=2953882 RepID=A0ABT1CDE4_9HYPH|nr:acetamidase/formamidase family protein [Mesorhizobium liriopis]MCO6052190.1 acetamidase/formamidase family protein [Mesorhizobium liriopis]
MTDNFVFHFGGHAATRTVRLGEPFTVFTEDCFGGRLSTREGRPREVAPYPQVNPLSGPFTVEDVRAGDILSIRILALKPARPWGVATISPNFGLLSGTRVSPNLQPVQDEHVWIWRLCEDGKTLQTEATDGRPLEVPFRPFLGTLGVAPAHGEVRLSVVPGDFGGNLDLPDLAVGAALHVRANQDGAHIYLGDGHFAQGDGEIAGTAVEGALHATIVVEKLALDPTFDWPRIETNTRVGVVGCARPLEDAARIAVAGLVQWMAAREGLKLQDAHQLVSQSCALQIGNLVNPLFSVLASVSKPHSTL